MKEVTMRDVAKAAGVSLATVSFALRNSPKISMKSREHVRSVAVQMGYRASPLVSASMARMRGSRDMKYQATLGWVNDMPDSGHWRESKGFIGAQARAEELGFVLDELYLSEIRMEEPHANVRRFCQIARARGIHGVILPELYRAQHVQEEWPDMAAVVIGGVAGGLHYSKFQRTNKFCQFHNIVVDIFSNIWIAFDALHDRGYRRIGLATTPWFNMHSDHRLRAAVLEFNEMTPARSRVEPFLDDHVGKNVHDSFTKWLKKTEPDVVLATHFSVAGWLEQVGLKIPQDIGLAHMQLGLMEQGWSGVDPQLELVGAAAIDLLSAHLIRNERGLPAYPKRISVRGCWHDGGTLREK